MKSDEKALSDEDGGCKKKAPTTGLTAIKPKPGRCPAVWCAHRIRSTVTEVMTATVNQTVTTTVTVDLSTQNASQLLSSNCQIQGRNDIQSNLTDSMIEGASVHSIIV